MKEMKSSITIDLYIAAMGRSGSTALANRLTIPHEQQVLVEPSAQAFGSSPFNLAENANDLIRYFATCSNLIDNSDIPPSLIGVKEVLPECHRAALDLLSANSIVVLVRDIREVALSLLEKSSRQNDKVWDLDRIFQYCLVNTKVLLELAQTSNSKVKVVRYEDIFFDAAAFARLLKNVKWQGDGDQFARLDFYGRSYEIDRNRNINRLSKISLEARGLTDRDLRASYEIASNCSAYQSSFSYE